MMHSDRNWFLGIVSLAAVGCGTSTTSALDASPPANDADIADTADAANTTDPALVEEFDVAYTPPAGGDPAMSLLDIYYVPDGKAKRLVLLVHGGSWIGGDKNNFRNTPMLIRWFVDRRYVVASANFRLASKPPGPAVATYADQTTDIAFALAWLKQNGAAYGITEPGVVLLGFSSGAHLVALLGTDARYLECAGLTADHLAASISLGVHAYDVPYALELMQGSDIEDNMDLIRFLFGDTKPEQLVASPANYAKKAAVPPTLVISSEASAIAGSRGSITSRASERYRDLLRASGHDASWIHYDDESHVSLVSDFGTPGDGPTEAVGNLLDGLSL